MQKIQPKKYFKQTTQFEYNGRKLPLLTTYKIVNHTITYRKIILPMIIIIHITYTLHLFIS